MKIKSVLHLVMVMVVGQLLFACNSVKYYEFAGHKQAPYMQPAKQKVAPATEEMVSLSEVALAAAEEKASADALAVTEPVLEASAAVAPVAPTKKVAPITIAPAVTEEVTAENTLTEAEAMAMAKERIASMTKAEKKELKKEFRETMRQNGGSGVSTVVKVIIAIFLPPLAVFLHDGLGSSFWINILLTLLFFVPGVIHALLVVTDTI
ncbi:YqaE/Pmp3 family membrane protein [Pontibacter sp. 13R65]|uniref:YqaE/Pmp3 family membrane protein n=2 Tax=Pontibacter sp. 13R65 TaxID=3127458 RepID=UPI00301BB8DF